MNTPAARTAPAQAPDLKMLSDHAPDPEVVRGAALLSSAAKKVPTNVWRMSTQFAGVLGPKQLTVKVAPKKGKEAYMVYIPRSGSFENRRVEIVFSKKGVEGLRQDFGEFIAESLGGIVGKWKKLEEMRAWVRDKRDDWKTKVRKQWKRKIERSTRSRRQLQMQSPVLVPSPVYTARGPRTRTIQVPPAIKHLFGQAAALRVYAREARESARRVKANVIVWIPPCDKTKRGKEISMGVRYGIQKPWMDFVADYVAYAASKWKTATQLQNWLNNVGDFRERVILLYEEQVT